MKSEVNEASVAPTYPYLGKESSGLIVLFSTKNAGTVVATGGDNTVGAYGLGYHDNNWFESRFKRFDGSVTLSN